MKRLRLALVSVLALALASCAPQGCVAGGPASVPTQGYAQPAYAPPVVYAQPGYVPPVVFVPLPSRRTVVVVRQTPAPVIRTGSASRAPAPVYRSQVSPYRSYAGSTSGGGFGGRRR